MQVIYQEMLAIPCGRCTQKCSVRAIPGYTPCKWYIIPHRICTQHSRYTCHRICPLPHHVKVLPTNGGRIVWQVYLKMPQVEFNTPWLYIHNYMISLSSTEILVEVKCARNSAFGELDSLGCFWTFQSWASRWCQGVFKNWYLGIQPMSLVHRQSISLSDWWRKISYHAWWSQLNIAVLLSISAFLSSQNSTYELLKDVYF